MLVQGSVEPALVVATVGTKVGEGVVGEAVGGVLVGAGEIPVGLDVVGAIVDGVGSFVWIVEVTGIGVGLLDRGGTVGGFVKGVLSIGDIARADGGGVGGCVVPTMFIFLLALKPLG